MVSSGRAGGSSSQPPRSSGPQHGCPKVAVTPPTGADDQQDSSGWGVAPVVLQVLGIRTITRDDAELNQARTAARTLEGDLNIATNQLVAPERSQTHEGTYARTAHEVVFRRTEALLVSAYTAALPPDANVSRTVCASGPTDLYIEYNGTFDLIEAKSSASHAYVRQALGQLLDYAYATKVPVTTLACLLPSRPANADVELLNAYGIDCIYRTGPSLFAREAARSTRRNVWDRSGIVAK